MTPEDMSAAKRAIAWMYGATSDDVAAAIEEFSGVTVIDDDDDWVPQALPIQEPVEIRRENLNPTAGDRRYDQ